MSGFSGRLWSVVVALFVLLPDPAWAQSASEASELARSLDLPREFVQRLSHRGILDRYASENHAVEAEIVPGPVPAVLRNRTDPRTVRSIRAEQPEPVMHYRRGLENQTLSFRAYRAPILDESRQRRPIGLPADGVAERERQAATIIRESLATDGLLATLARVIEELGPESFRGNREESVRKLEAIGYPVDLLRYFQNEASDREGNHDLIGRIAGELSRGTRAEAMCGELGKTRFVFVKTCPDFVAAEENGEYEIGLLRVQIGGGYDGGIIRGGSLDVTGQLIAAMPETDLIASAPEEFFENIRWLAINSWPLRRPNRLVLVEEKGPVSPWAQDNGKAGYLLAGAKGFGAPATLTPRYATRDELDWRFCPGESFLMDGLQAAGHSVFQSPLLFQGGNALVIRDPKRGERILLLAETEVYRNLSLGLTRDQVLDAFRIEFGVNRCVVMPVVSYHLDYDITFRVHDGQLVAFVNDAVAAARLIVLRGIAALEHYRVLDGAGADGARTELARTQPWALHARMQAVLAPYRNEKQQFRASFISLFASEQTDQPVLNFQCFLAALDILATSVDSPEPKVPSSDRGQAQSVSMLAKDGSAKAYFAALMQLQIAAKGQQEYVRSLGWRVVPVPSMPDLYHSVNYLNGLHDRTRYLMPAMGGFYAVLDNAAAAVFQNTLGTRVKLVRVLTPEIQRQHGGVHCVVAAYPRVRQTQDTGFNLVAPTSL